LILISAPKRDA